MFFDNINDVERKIDDNIAYLGELNCKIKMFCASNVRDIVPEDWKEQPIDWINNQIDELLSIIKETTEENHKLSLYYQYLSEKA